MNKLILQDLDKLKYLIEENRNGCVGSFNNLEIFYKEFVELAEGNKAQENMSYWQVESLKIILKELSEIIELLKRNPFEDVSEQADSCSCKIEELKDTSR